MIENFKHKIYAAIASWTMSTDQTQGGFQIFWKLQPGFAAALTEHIMPVVEETIKLSEEAWQSQKSSTPRRSAKSLPSSEPSPQSSQP